METELGTVIQFPTDRWVGEQEPQAPVALSCIDCQNIFVGTKGLFCGFFKENIEFDEVASECPEFEPF